MMLLPYRDLKDELLATVIGLKGVENGRKLIGIELDYTNVSVSYFH
jgi:hypothetical protein